MKSRITAAPRLAPSALLLALGLAFLFPVRLPAGVPEPDTVLYGSIALDGQYITADDASVSVELRATPDGPALRTYQMGSSPRAGNLYVLRASAESAPPLLQPGALSLGSTVHILVRDASGIRDSKSHVLAERGTFVRIDFGDVDSDGDGMSDAFESTYFGGPTGGNALLDPDADGRPNLREFLDNTDPLVADGRHPADLSPANDAISIAEVTAYTLAWQLGEAWSVEPFVIPVDYVTRAGALWKGGESYVFNNTPPTNAPMWWVNPPPGDPALHTEAVAAGVSPGGTSPRALATAPHEPTLSRSLSLRSKAQVGEGGSAHAEPGEGAHGAAGVSPAVEPGVPPGGTSPRALATVAPRSLPPVTRAAPSHFNPSPSTPVRIRVNPLPGTLSFAVEETPPAGWILRNISHGGRLDRVHHKIKWGPFYDTEPRELTYDATPLPGTATPGAFEGIGSFNGLNVTLAGVVQVLPPGVFAPHILTYAFAANGQFRFQLTGTPGARYVIEASANLQEWIPLQTVTADDAGSLDYAVAQLGLNQRFFRARSAE